LETTISIIVDCGRKTGLRTQPSSARQLGSSIVTRIKTRNANLLETLADVCRGIDITPFEVKEAMSPEAIAG